MVLLDKMTHPTDIPILILITASVIQYFFLASRKGLKGWQRGYAPPLAAGVLVLVTLIGGGEFDPPSSHSKTYAAIGVALCILAVFSFMKQKRPDLVHRDDEIRDA